ncbi:MAG TPA: glycoside hydrolase family 2 TIM barrel-domain containing protein [Puia sp.]|nr:glycoside hydrolase family 2 TIM barrel-domain containing protein [Puia sp.]
MKKRSMKQSLSAALLFLLIGPGHIDHGYPQQEKDSAVPVKIENRNGVFRLLRGGEKYFIKGAVGYDYLGRLARYGGNSIRIPASKEILDKADSLHLTALVNLPVLGERDGMDYNDTASVHAQSEKVLDIVRRLKNHPAVLIWALGNEMEFVRPEITQYNTRVWEAVNALTEEIHRIDPDHPVMTVLGSVSRELIGNMIRLSPSLDLIGINAYGDINKVPGWLRAYGWEKPYVITEWGPTGFWQVPETRWHAPIEETSSMKADKYRQRYEQVILGDDSLCLGSYVFLWRQHQERTHTWFGMFDTAGLETEAVNVMNYEWSGRWPANKAPRVDSMKIGDRTAYQNIELLPGQKLQATAWVKDPDKDNLTYNWEVLKEGTNFPYGGRGERKPDAVPELIRERNNWKITFAAPSVEGPYRLFMYAYDGHGHWATANIPFFVKKPQR